MFRHVYAYIMHTHAIKLTSMPLHAFKFIIAHAFVCLILFKHRCDLKNTF